MKRGIKNILLSLLGFSASPILTACYGMPEPQPDQFWDREFKGKVTDTLGNPIEGIKVFVGTHNCDWDEEGYYTYAPIKSVTPSITDAEGNFTIYIGQIGWGADFVAEDIDGEKNGLYRTVGEDITAFDGTIEMEEIATEEETDAKL